MSAWPNALSIRLEYVRCCHEDCGVTVIMTEQEMRDYRRNHKWWYCHRGHRQVFNGESDVEAMRRERDEAIERERRAQKAMEWERVNHQHTKNSLAATKGHVTRQKKRAAAGVCPCCNRTFQQLAKHMASKHPGYGGSHGRSDA